MFIGGTIGEVSVDWSVDQGVSTAQYDVDYRADGATLLFLPGDTRKCKFYTGQRFTTGHLWLSG